MPNFIKYLTDIRAHFTIKNRIAKNNVTKTTHEMSLLLPHNGLEEGQFFFSLYKNDPKTMSKVLYRATKYMNAEDTLVAREEKPKKRERQEDTQQDQGRKKARIRDRRDERRPKPQGGRFTSFTPLTAPIDQVLMQIKDEEALTYPGKLKGDPNRRSRGKYCRFHRDHGHDTVDCYDLKQ